MRRLWTFALLTLLALTASASAGECIGCKTRCIVPPPLHCREQPCPCEHRLNLAIFGKADKYIRRLSCENSCCTRIKAAKKLGCRLHADFCANKGVREALLDALYFDSCWRVRKAIAWSLFGQRAATDEVILALYISSKLDPHAVVRGRAAEALDLLLLDRRPCYKELFASADQFIKELRAAKFVPGKADARDRYALAAMPASEISN